MNERSNQLVIGICGPLGSGVSTTAEALAKHGGFNRISLSEPIKKAYCQARGTPLLFQSQSITPAIRISLQDLGNQKRTERIDYWIEAALTNAPTNKPLIIDGIRNLGEVDSLRRRFPSFFLISLYADPSVRWSRLANQFNQNFKDFTAADKRDSKENNQFGQQVSECVAVSDYVLVNNELNGAKTDQLAYIYKKISDDVKLMSIAHGIADHATSRSPTSHEAHMAAAYAQSHISRCLKRHVGAVIVSENGIPLSMGFNENPIYMKPCKDGLGHCFKDADMHRKLEAMTEFCCPKCGTKHSAMPQSYTCKTETCKCDFKSIFFPSRNIELCTAIHAEERAIRSLGDRSAKDGTLLTTTFPCLQCARYIIDAQLAKVIYVEAYPITESRDLLEKCDIEVAPFEGFKARAFNIIFRQVP